MGSKSWFLKHPFKSNLPFGYYVEHIGLLVLLVYVMTLRKHQEVHIVGKLDEAVEGSSREELLESFAFDFHL